MWNLRALFLRLRHLRRRRLDQELEEEIRFHLEMAARDKVADGGDAAEARMEAAKEFGNLLALKERSRDMFTFPTLETIIQDVRIALRTLRKNPAFLVVAVLTLALGIGANTAIFSVVNAALLRPLPYAKPQELVTWRHNESLADVSDIRARSGALFSAGGAVNDEPMDYTGGAEPLGINAGYVDADLFDVLGVPAMLGRTLSPEEDRLGGPRVVVLSYLFWRTSLSADPNIVGETIPLNGNSYTVVGVMPASFLMPEHSVDLFVSLRAVYRRLPVIGASISCDPTGA